MSRTIRIALPTGKRRSYHVIIRSGSITEIPGLIARQWQGRDVFVITDENVRKLYGRLFMRGLTSAGVNSWLLDVPAGEKSKNAEVAFALQTHLLEQGIRRESLIVALGGGVIGDLAGYVAATVLRGVRYVQVPTTLLAQVDSSVGGKVGIDHPLGKNLIGAFHQPAAVYIDPEVLRTLPDVEFRNGLAEVVKIAAALDGKLFARLERIAPPRLTKNNGRLLGEIIAQAVGLKAKVVERDELESGLRKTLNLGHTIGHAIEAASDFKTKHGTAVAMGLVAESSIAVRMGILKQRDFERVVKLLQRLKLPTSFPQIKGRSKFFHALSVDKKSESGMAKFVLLKAIGNTVIGVDVPTPFIVELL